MLSPHPSNVDIPFLFNDFHDPLSVHLCEFAQKWTTPTKDDWISTTIAVQELSKAQVSHLCIPETYGGKPVNQPFDVDTRSLTLARECLAWSDGLLDTAFAMQGLGSYPISIFGDEDQKARYLPGFLNGERIGAFALTEPQAGSDLKSLKMKARYDETTGDYILHGTKTFISNAGVATQYIIFADTSPRRKKSVLTAFIVEPTDPGVKIEPFEVMAPHPIGTLNLWQCRIPKARRLGAEGDGLKIALKTLGTFRLSVAGAALGMARRALDEALQFSLSRKLGDGVLFDQQQISASLADCATELDAARLIVYRAGHTRDTFGEESRKEVAMAKLFATETAQRIIDRCLQIHGGLGIKRGEVLERLYREVRALRIYEGASEVQRNIISREMKNEAEND